jgi:SpoVK/Ycf46/Vps4 family AAA+-type ATPase
MLNRHFAERLVLLVLGAYLSYFFTLKLLDYSMLQELSSDVIEIPSDLKLNNHEKMIYSMVVKKENISTDFEDVKGLEATKNTIQKQVIIPLKHLNTNTHKLLQPPNGIIFHGSPGTGKTMLAKALCKSSGFNFINFSTNIIENKLFGESSKLVNSLFTLANKLKPCVVFIDEIDGFFNKRNDFEQGFITNIKTLFYMKMDGMISKDNSIVFIGATNRIGSIDPAMLRRMRLHIHIGLPDWTTRKTMFKHYLGPLLNFDIEGIETETDGLSGSDIHEICKVAANDSYDYVSKSFLNFNQEVLLNTTKEFVT